MVTQPQISTSTDVQYPESDGQPMADNTKQFRWIVVIEQNLEWLFKDNADVFVAGDLLWYPVEGNNSLSTAPDAMVVFGRPKGDRGSYLQWREDNIPPQVVFEILSPSNTQREMNRKLLFYNNYGVEEYYLYDPDHNQLKGWCHSDDGFLDQIEAISGWVSPRLTIRFELGEELQLYRSDGTPFLSFVEINQKLEQEHQRTELLEQQVEQERQRAEQEQQRAEQSDQRTAEIEILLQQYRDRFGELDR
jgi:Uma2 family endonuclease